jgi:hypothetical protein
VELALRFSTIMSEISVAWYNDAKEKIRVL